MDLEELQGWLGDEDSAADAPVKPLFGDTGAADRAPRRRGWGRIALSAAGVWLVVMAVVVTRGGSAGEGPAAVADPSAVAGAPTAAPVAVPSIVPTTAPTSGPANAPANAPSSAPTTPPVGAATEHVPITSDEAGPAVAGAIHALRSHLAASVVAPASAYLEWAVPVHQRPVAEEVDIVVLDALWLTASGDSGYDAEHRGRWAVPVSLAGEALATPWPVTAPELEQPEPLPPPSGVERREEVVAALEAAGWAEVLVQGSEAHPELDRVHVAFIDGIAPDGSRVTGAIVWLVDGADGLAVLGGGSDA